MFVFPKVKMKFSFYQKENTLVSWEFLRPSDEIALRNFSVLMIVYKKFK